jgi:hypothetical protein
MVTVRINDEIKKPVAICWQDCDTDTFERLFATEFDEANPVAVFAVVADLPLTTVSESRNEVLEQSLYGLIEFVYKQPQKFREIAPPRSIRIRDKVILVPSNLQTLTVGQNFQIRKALSENRNLESCISLAVAVYLQPLVDGMLFDMKKALELQKEIKKMNIYETFPVGFFFLNRLRGSGLAGIIYYLRQSLMKMRSMLSSLKQRK